MRSTGEKNKRLLNETDPLLLFPNCKINIGLRVTGRRPDGYHNIETVFFPLQWFDVLELLNATETSLTLYGLPVPATVNENIVLKAFHLLKKDFPGLPPVAFHLLKNVPPGAGLGAGSANGAFALMALNKKFNLGLSEAQLLSYALCLGSDCPFFILNQAAFATGRGEKFTRINLMLEHYRLLIVNPGIHISTPWAFRQIRPEPATLSLAQLAEEPVREWKDKIINDFEPEVFKAYPVIGQIKNKLYESGAMYASMSGTGSTVYGIFKEDAVPAIGFPEHFLVKNLPMGINAHDR